MEKVNFNTLEKNIWEIVQEMKCGWNLGNSLDAIGIEKPLETVLEYETSWGNPKITKALIQKVIKSGFNTIRIPVTYQGKFEHKPGHIIDPVWLDRVEEVVNYAYEEGVFVIIDTHHEDEWLGLGDKSQEEKALVILYDLWIQIAERFKDYDYHLIFETMNETRLIGTDDEWTPGTSEARAVVNQLNEVAVKAIRKTGSNNCNRAIIIPTYAARPSDVAINDLIIPNDNMIILAVHSYDPYFFCMVPEETAHWGTTEDVEELSRLFDSISLAAKRKGVPLIIGEFGTINKCNEEARALYTTHFMQEARKRNIKCILWDNDINTDFLEHSFAQLDRKELSWRYPKILNAILQNS